MNLRLAPFHLLGWAMAAGSPPSPVLAPEAWVALPEGGSATRVGAGPSPSPPAVLKGRSRQEPKGTPMGSLRVRKGTAPTERALNREPSWLHLSTVGVGEAGPPQGTDRLPRGCSTAGAGGNPPHGIPARGSGPPNRPASAGPLLKTMLPLYRQALHTLDPRANVSQQCSTALRTDTGGASLHIMAVHHCTAAFR